MSRHSSPTLWRAKVCSPWISAARPKRSAIVFEPGVTNVIIVLAISRIPIFLRTVRAESLRSQMGIVPQEAFLFSGTIGENIAFGRPGATAAEIRAAADAAHVTEFVEALPRGFDTLVGERGVKLSGGQRQRVAIARAILRDAPILLLDEATSALDSESEALIQGALWTMMEGRTAIAVAHRLSTVAGMDRLVVLDRGRVVEQGTRAELLASGGGYAKLWQRQSGGFLGE